MIDFDLVIISWELGILIFLKQLSWLVMSLLSS